MSHEPISDEPRNTLENEAAEMSEYSSAAPFRAPTQTPRSASRKGWFNNWMFGMIPVLVGAGIFVACSSHKEASVESTSSASVSGDTKTEKYPDENLDGFESVKKGKKKPLKGSHGVKSARHVPAENMYVVQIGAFRVKANAEKLNEKLKSAGYPVEMQQIEHSSNGQLYLVRLNPLTERQAAEEMRSNLKAKIDIDSMILALPKDERAVASTHGASNTTLTGNGDNVGKSNSGSAGSKNSEREAAGTLDSRSSEIR